MTYKGIKQVCSDSKTLIRQGMYLQLNLNVKTGEVWSDKHFSIGHGTRFKYEDSNIHHVCNIDQYMTMAEIREALDRHMACI